MPTPFYQSRQQNQNPTPAIMDLGVWDGERLRDRVEEKWVSREIGAENEEINQHCQCWARAWIGNKWKNWSLQGKKWKVRGPTKGERGPTRRNGEEKEKKKYIYIYIYSNHQCEHNIIIFFFFYLWEIEILLSQIFWL